MRPRKFGATKPKSTQKGRQIEKAVKRAVHDYKASFKRLATE
jgi:hypothetical protein